MFTITRFTHYILTNPNNSICCLRYALITIVCNTKQCKVCLKIYSTNLFSRIPETLQAIVVFGTELFHISCTYRKDFRCRCSHTIPKMSLIATKTAGIHSGLLKMNAVNFHRGNISFRRCKNCWKQNVCRMSLRRMCLLFRYF